MLYVSSIGAYVDQCEWLERATPHPSKRCAMLLSMSPRRSWRSMLTSFGCEQIVQVRAMQSDSKESPGQGSLKTYSGTGSRAQPRKAPAPTELAMTYGNCVYEPMAVRLRDTLERNRRATRD